MVRPRKWQGEPARQKGKGLRSETDMRPGTGKKGRPWNTAHSKPSRRTKRSQIPGLSKMQPT